MHMTNRCLVTELGQFKQSSKEAVESPDDQFNKEYIHVKRACERELEEILEGIQKVNRPHLVMICGSVGDGKSHLISYLKHHRPDLFSNVTIHNDATESFSPTKTSIDTLREELYSFNDESLKNGVEGSHMVVAINLGMLNNFLNSEYQNEFTQLRRFVGDQKIIDEEQSDYDYDRSLPFRFINLSDYHLYELTSDGVRSSFQEGILEKVTTSDAQNPFYEVYNQYCINNCPVGNQCPVKKNYELLQRKSVQLAIINKLAELNIKYKVIISPRSYLDFIYHIIVYGELRDLQDPTQVMDKIRGFSILDHLKALLPNLLFDYSTEMELFSKLKLLQPDSIRSERMDQLAIDFFIIGNLRKTFQKYIDSEVYQELGIAELLHENNRSEDLQVLLYRTLLRLTDLGCGSAGNDLLQEDSVYSRYLKDLYNWNRGDEKELKPLYQGVIEAVYHLNGDFGSQRTKLNIGKKQSTISVCHKLDVEPRTGYLKQRQEEYLERFLTHMILKFGVEGSKDRAVDIDFHLYQLIDHIKFGYRPNHYDRNNFISFVDFVDQINHDGSQKQQIEFHVQKGSKKEVFSLYKDNFDDYVFSEENG